ncbi:MAG: LptE family protein [Ignavibacteriales bacterium]|nr:LptE family protein [Ignavibacteriales bacterium]
MYNRFVPLGVIFLLVLTGTAVLAISGCRYSFSGGSVPPNLKTIAIPIVQDQSGYGDPSLKDTFTERLVESFTSDGSLTLAERNFSDSVLETVVTGVREFASVVQPGEQVAQRRITVTARVKFTDTKQRKLLWEKEFNQWGDFPSGAGATQRNEGIREAIRKLTEDILNQTVAGW